MSEETLQEKYKREREEKKVKLTAHKATVVQRRSEESLRSRLRTERADRIAEKKGVPTQAQQKEKAEAVAMFRFAEKMKPFIDLVGALEKNKDIPTRDERMVVSSRTEVGETKHPVISPVVRKNLSEVITFYTWVDGEVGTVDIKCDGEPVALEE